MLDIPITRALGVNPVSAWVESNLDALVKMYIPGIKEIEIRGKTIDSEYTCVLTFLYDKKEEVWLFPANYNDYKIRDYANADGISISSISPHKVFNGEKIEVRIVFYADKIDFDNRNKSKVSKKSYKYSWEMAKGGMTNDEIYAPEGYFFVKIGSHRALKKALLENIKYISLFTFSRVRSAGESTFFMSETDFKKIQNIVGVTRLKKINGIWFSRFEDRRLDKIFEKIRIEPYSEGGMTRRRYNDGGGVPYKNLSLEKPQVIMDSNMEEDTGENGLAEIEIVKTRTISIPAINTSGQITSSSDAAKLFRAIWHTDQMNVAEHFNVILLNRSNKPIGFYQHSIGGVTGTIVDVELICASAIKSLSKGVLVAHNHPSGNLKPSQSDLKITKELKDALALFQISLVDSMILVPSSPQYYSMLDEGLL